MASRSLIPSIQHLVNRDAKNTELFQNDEHVMWLITGVFAVEATSKKNLDKLWDLWQERPRGLRLEPTSSELGFKLQKLFV